MPEPLDPLFLSFQSALAGRYSLERELGRGGMGVVYLAREVRLDRLVAIKLLPPLHAARPELRERFLREARTAAKLSHPNIIPIYAVDEVGDFVFFAMAHVEGQTLSARVRQRGPLPPSDAARILREVAWALAYAHAQGVIHRDVKPENILLEAATGRALVADFGIARVVQAGGLTAAGEVLGTAEFMSPEQAAGDAVDARSDLYALGIVAHYALSGRLPFEGPNVGDVLAQQITRPSPPLASVAPGVPRRLARAIDRCLAKDPAERFESGEALAEALGLSLEARKELPVPVRAFLARTRDLGRMGCVPTVLILYLGSIFVSLLVRGGPAGWISLAVLVGGLVAVPVGVLIHRARRLLRAGYGLEDVSFALKTELDRRREELAYEFGREPSALDRRLRRIIYGALALAGACLGALFLVPGVATSGGVASVLTGSAIVSVIGAIVARVREERRTDISAVRRLKRWSGPFGRWLFKLAGLRLKPVAALGPATHRPTEFAIGMAAESLFEALPAETRNRLRDLPNVIRRLEADAQKMRRRLDELQDALGDVDRKGDEGRATGAAPDATAVRRARVLADLEAERELVQRRLAEAVAALETIRLELLRLRAGAGSVESLTADLAAAREVGKEIEVLLESRREVERILRP